MAKVKKFGAFSGVFVPSILTILGVILYLRLPWIVGQAGLLPTLGIILVAHIISVSTGLSVASIATDKRVGTGGTYFIISRSLGLPIGGTLGYALFVGLSFSVSLYLIGFAESFLSYFGFEVSLNTIRITGSIILLLVTTVTFISTSLAIKTQYLILVVLILSLLAIFLGNHEYIPHGPQLNSVPESLPWIALFAIFFPAVTGFEAGVSMSGDLKDPRKDIPIGTISAIIAGLLVYTGITLFLSTTVNRDLLINDSNALFKISLIPQLVIAGILVATLSSALGSILGAPRIMQAVAIDRIAPAFFSKGYGPSNEPRNALILTYVIAQAGILIGELNVIARIVSTFFIITYGFLNITYTVESWASSDFRPSFKIPRFVSIIGALACIIVMIQLDILALIAASLILVTLFFYLKNKELSLQTGDTRSSVWLSLVKTGLLKLTKVRTDARNWRPNVILFSGGAGIRPHLIETGKALVGNLGIFTNFELVEHPGEDLLFSRTARVSTESIGEHNNVITRKHECRNIYEGIEMISKIYGFTGFEPNTILMGWAKNTKEPEKFAEMLINLKKLDYSMAFLNFNKERGFGNYKKIDFWWKGEGNNLPLAIHFIRFITATTEWRNAEVRLLALCANSINIEKYYRILNQIIENYRIRAEIKVINNVEKIPENEYMQSESSDTDLIIAEIPYFDKNNITEEIENVNIRAENINTCLFIHASSGFEEINVITEIPGTGKISVDYEKPLLSVTDKINLTGNEYVQNEVTNLARVLENNSEKFLNDTFSVIPKNRNVYIEQFFTLCKKTFDKLISVNDLKKTTNRQWEYLKIINDYSFEVQKQVKNYRDNCLKSEQEILEKGISKYISDTLNAGKTMPETFRLKFDKNNIRQLKTSGISEWINKSLKLIWVSLRNKPVSYKININKTYRFFLYHNRLRYFKKFSERFFIQNLQNFSEIKNLLRENYDFIEQIQIQKTTNNNIVNFQKKVSENFKNIQIKNKEYSYTESQKLLQELIYDIENFNKIIQSPLAPAMSRKFRPALKKDSHLEVLISNFIITYQNILSNFINKTLLDFILLSLKNRIKSKFEKTLYDVELILQTNILNQLNEFEKQLNIIRETGKNQNNKTIFKPKEISIPDLNEYFTTLLNDIKEAVDELPQNFQLSAEELPGTITLEQLQSMDEFLVSVRKSADIFISNEVSDQLKKQFLKFESKLSLSLNKIQDIIKLVNFQLYNLNNTGSDLTESILEREQQNSFIEDLIKSIIVEENKIKNLTIEIRTSFDRGLKNAFEPLSSATIVKTSASIKKITKETGKQKLINRYQSYKISVKEKIIRQFVKLLYTTSEGQIWARRLEHYKEKESVYSKDHTWKVIGELSPLKSIIESLPFYYANLFSGNSRIGEDFWVGMKNEIEQGNKAVKQFFSGIQGFLIISGERSSGKSSLSKHLANLHFKKENIYNVNAPRECTADIQLFEKSLLKSINGKNNLELSMNLLTPKSVIIIHDLELWWERKPNGTRVIEKIISLMQEFSNKIFFIININEYALKIINQLTSLNTRALDIVFCQPFDARDLKNLIMLRHKAGGMKFILDKKHEDQMTEWDYARFFNRYFNLSSGNPGYAINLWLAGIKKISGTTLIIEKPSAAEINFTGQLSQHETLYILQFLVHRRLSANNLSELLHANIDNTEKIIRELLQKNILTEEYQEIYSINPVLENYLISNFKSLKLI